MTLENQIELLRAYLPLEDLAALARGDAPDAAQIAAACEQLRAELESIASFIPGGIVRRQIANPQPGQVSGAYWDGSVLFADMSGFTALSGKLAALGKQGAEEISAIINSLFAALVAEIYRYDGELLKFGGDAITAFFDARQLGSAHAGRAAKAALAMQDRMRAFSNIPTRAGAFQLRLRVGVHSGRVFSAEVGDLSHIELVVTGRNINRVAEAQEIAEPGQVVITHETMQLIPGLAAQEQSGGFFLIEDLPMMVPSSRLRSGVWEAGAGDLVELTELALRLQALRPYLPNGLPRRFLEQSDTSEIGEFRPVTVLFANFYPFSQILTLLGDDADRATAILNAYYQRAQATVHRFGGIVNKVDMYTHGDKLMALFGAPVANEDDPERAVRCALALANTLAEANAEIAPLLRRTDRLIAVDPLLLRQKIGINTGVVFAGQVGSLQRREYSVMGQPVNLSARLMGVAESGTAVLSPGTRRAVEANITLRELPPVQLKGIVDPVAIVQAVGVRSADRQQERLNLQRLEMIGRAEELAKLRHIAYATLDGRGRVAAVVGEMGIGKTRLLAELVDLLPGASVDRPGLFPHLVECQSYDQSTPYATARQILTAILRLSGDPPHVARRIERRVAALAPELARFAPLLGDILAAALPETPLTQALSPEQRHERVLELIDALVIGSAREEPFVLIVDDLHWSDASSVEVLLRLARLAPQAPLLLLLSYRSDVGFGEPWLQIAECERVALAELPADGSAALVRALLGGYTLPGQELLLERTQGNPFFIEAVVQSLIESGALVHSEEGWRITRPLSEIAIPDNVEGVITARLDRLAEPLRETVQVAAVIGRRFTIPVLEGVLPQRRDLPERLTQLCESDIVAPELDTVPSYQFTHALTADVAYESILYARRRELHRRVALRIEELFPDRIDEQLGLLSHHYRVAEEWNQAFDYHVRAGRRAQERFANREAISFFDRSIQITHEMSTRGLATPDTALVDLYEQLGAIYALLGEYDTAEDRYEAARYLLAQSRSPDRDAEVRLLYGLARVEEKRAQFEQAFARVEEALVIANGQPSDPHTRCLLLGAGLLRRFGRYPQSIEWGQRAFAMAEAIESPRHQAEALLQLGGTYGNMGESQRAFDLTNQSLGLFQSVSDLSRLADAHNNLGNICFDLGRLVDARTNYEMGAEIKQAIGDVYGQGMVAINLGEVFRLQGQLDEAIAQYARALAIFEKLSSHYMSGVLHMNLGAAYLRQGQLASAEEHLNASAELFAQAGAEDFLPELERHTSELDLRRGDLSSAYRRCQQALATAVRLEARGEEGITRRLLAEIRGHGGDPQGAWEELDRSLAILREAAQPHEIARTLVAQALLAPQIGRDLEGRAAIQAALPLLAEVGAQRDLEEAQQIAARYEAGAAG